MFVAVLEYLAARSEGRFGESHDALSIGSLVCGQLRGRQGWEARHAGVPVVCVLVFSLMFDIIGEQI